MTSSLPYCRKERHRGENIFKKKFLSIMYYKVKWKCKSLISGMRKTFFFKKILTGILLIWFFLCILPGDCLLLGCAEKNSLYCTEKESVIVTHIDADSSIPLDVSHCSNCCALCAHNIVMGLLQDSSLFLCSPSSRVKTIHFNHSKSIIQAVIYHPPRLTA